MKCRHFFSFVLVACLSFFFGSFIITNDSFALEYSGTLDASNSNAIGVCNNNGNGSLSGHPCSDFLYIALSFSGTITGSNAPYVQYANVNYRLGNLANPTVVKITENVSFFTGNISSLSSDWVVNYTLSDTYPFNCSDSPSGSITLSENGTFDVTNYATAIVDVPAQVIQGEYHDDLIDINRSIITCGAILLVLYFFYCIYRLIIKNSGVE